MTTRRCPTCDAENPVEAKSCHHCGGSLGGGGPERSEPASPVTPVEAGRPGDEQEKAEPAGHFKTLVAILIAVVSIAGAVVAWRIATATSRATDADVGGIVSTVSRNQALVASEAEMYKNLEAYLRVRIGDLLSDNLIVESERRPLEDPERGRLWDEAWTEIFVAEAYRSSVDIRPEYIRPDGSYDGQASQDIDMAHRALSTDFDLQGRHFAEADRLRFKVQVLIGLALVLSVVLVLYTLAEVITRRSKYVFLALGTLIFILVLVALPLVELTLG